MDKGQVSRLRAGRAITLGIFVCPLALPSNHAAGQSTPTQPASFPSAREAVRTGNQLLRDGKPEEALRAYAQAKSLEPGALEIPFVQGLGRYQLQDYPAARDLWSSAALAGDPALADAATYSLGTTYHSEALRQSGKPEEAGKLLEQAMERYQQVLAHDPRHLAARDSLRKAAALRRQIKEMAQQQQEPNQKKSEEEKQEESEQDQSSENSQQNEEESEKSEEQQSQDSSEQQEKQEQESSQQEQPDQESPSESASQDKQDESESKDQQQSSDSPEERESEESSDKMKTQPTEEDHSREQAERQLREMMQSLRDRQKNRKEPTRRVPIQPAEKDW